MNTAPTRFHVALAVSDLERSIAFYRAFLGREPAKVRPDYAKFETDDPPLVLSLDPGASPSVAGTRNVTHLGLRVGSRPELERIRRTLRGEGLALADEGRTTCCYAVQDKFWVTDPDGNDWEVYELLADAEEPREEPGADAATKPACCSGTAASNAGERVRE